MAAADPHYKLTDHSCTQCFGRLLIRPLLGRKPRFEVICSECEEKHIITSESDIPCWCNKVEGFNPDGSQIKNAGLHGNIFECIVNPKQSLSVPNRILVRERPMIMKPPEARINRSVFVPEDYQVV